MGQYIPPSIRTVREDIQGSVVITGAEVIPLLIGKTNGAKTTIAAFAAALAGGSSAYLFAVTPPVDSIIQVRSLAVGGIIYVPTTDWTFDSGTQTITFTASTISQPFAFDPTPANTGGSLTAGTYWYVITAFKTTDLTGPVVGETIQSNSVKAVIAGAATHGAVTGTAVVNPTIALTPGGTIIGNTDAIGNQTATFTAVSAQRTGVGGTFAAAAGEVLLVSVNGGPTQTITFTAEATEAAYMATINAQLVGGSAVDSVGQIKLQSDRKGNTASIAVVAGTSAALLGGGSKLGFSVGTSTGTGNVGDIDAVTFTEIKTVIEAALTNSSGVTVSQDGAFHVVITSNTTGATSSIQIDAASTLDTTLGLDNALHSGSNAGSTGLVKLTWQTVPGAEGYKIYRNTANSFLGPNDLLATVVGGFVNTYSDNGSVIPGAGFPPVVNTAFKRPALHGGTFFVDYSTTVFNYFQIQRFTNLGLLLNAHGLGSNLGIAGTLILGSSGRGNAASICLTMSIPDDNLLTYQTALQMAAPRKDVDIVVPLNTADLVRKATLAHCDLMSNVDNKRERICILGTAIGTVPGDTSTANTAVFIASGLFDRRAVLVYPWCFHNVEGVGGVTETELDGWAAAAAFTGMIAALPDRAESPTSKQILGITKTGGPVLDEPTMNILGAAGVMVIEVDEVGNIICRDGITTTTDNEADQQININLTDDFLRKTLRTSFRAFRGRKLLSGLLNQIEKRTNKVLENFFKLQLIAGYDPKSISAQQDPNRLTFVIVRFTYNPVFPLRVIEFQYSLDLRPVALAA